MARIAIDMDGVMADTTQQMIDWYANRYGVQVDKATLYGIPETTGFPHEKEVIRKFLFEPGFFRTKPVIKDSQEVIRALQDKYEVFIVSAAMEFTPSLPEKVDWLAEHFPFISWQNIVFCGSKTIIQADYMIDDHVKNLQPFKGQGLMFTAPHNVNVTDFKRVDTWQDVAGLLL
ncbi:5' nucleotidase, NT5C type [Chitinophaga rhizophila]|uniref:5'(3')-deoxyribonucleotidase n=1 Tax=Chitinophaga rhizophila TaxID=2866212 RepID=A0ABS7GFT4_9BACT|nr:5'(3')-deoxyribonucleotidase [Chitinophaga rhizophila]MBW8686271.1 5'(3')-deoxyribonucleotidase [Chitinophaga rhizophila]